MSRTKQNDTTAQDKSLESSSSSQWWSDEGLAALDAQPLTPRPLPPLPNAQPRDTLSSVSDDEEGARVSLAGSGHAQDNDYYSYSGSDSGERAPRPPLTQSRFNDTEKPDLHSPSNTSPPMSARTSNPDQGNPLDFASAAVQAAKDAEKEAKSSHNRASQAVSWLRWGLPHMVVGAAAFALSGFIGAALTSVGLGMAASSLIIVPAMMVLSVGLQAGVQRASRPTPVHNKPKASVNDSAQMRMDHRPTPLVIDRTSAPTATRLEDECVKKCCKTKKLA